MWKKVHKQLENIKLTFHEKYHVTQVHVVFFRVFQKVFNPTLLYLECFQLLNWQVKPWICMHYESSEHNCSAINVNDYTAQFNYPVLKRIKKR